MLFGDSKNYRENFKAAVEDCVTGKLKKEQGINLLKTRFDYALLSFDKAFDKKIVFRILMTFASMFLFMYGCLMTVN